MEHFSVSILGLFGLLALAVLMLPLAKKLKIPYTVLLALVGCLVGGVQLFHSTAPEHGVVSELLEAIRRFQIDSDTVLFVFVPVLVFESALSINTHRLFEDLAPILALAIIGLLISTFLIGFVLWQFSGFALVVCLLLGAILSATDPVAVVALFRELQAPKRLAVLVEGESLFNDATAIVLFTLLSKILLENAEGDWIGGSVDFLKVFLGGVLIGYLLGMVLCQVFKKLEHYPLVIITLTISLAYIAFVAAEHYFHVSGVMAAVSGGLVLGSVGRAIISPSTWNLMKEVWDIIGFWANSVIFLLVGMAIPRIMVGMGFDNLSLFLVLVVTAFAARAMIIFGLVPVMSVGGWVAKVSTAYKTVMFWGGLRGAVSLALGLAVMENPAFPEEVRQFIGVMVTAFVLFTLFVNATTISSLMRFFGLDKLTPVDQAIRYRAVETAMKDLSEEIQTASQRLEVPPESMKNVLKKYEDQMAHWREARQASAELSRDDLVRIGLADLTHLERDTYLELFDEQLIGSHLVRLLLNRSEDILDGIHHGGEAGYERAWQKGLQFDWRYRPAMFLLHRFGYPGWTAGLLSDRMNLLLTQHQVLKDVRARGLPRYTEFLGQESGAVLERLLDRRRNAVEKALTMLKLQFPDYSEQLERRHLAQMVLRMEDSRFRDLLKTSLISKEVFRDLEKELDESALALEEVPKLDLGIEPQHLLTRVPFLSNLPPDQVQHLTGLMRSHLALPGEVIIHKGEPGREMYFISSGCVEVEVEPQPVQLGSGDFFGEMALLYEQPRMADVVAHGFCNLMVLPTQAFREWTGQHPEIRETLDRVAQERLAADEKGASG